MTSISLSYPRKTGTVPSCVHAVQIQSTAGDSSPHFFHCAGSRVGFAVPVPPPRLAYATSHILSTFVQATAATCVFWRTRFTNCTVTFARASLTLWIVSNRFRSLLGSYALCLSLWLWLGLETRQLAASWHCLEKSQKTLKKIHSSYKWGMPITVTWTMSITNSNTEDEVSIMFGLKIAPRL